MSYAPARVHPREARGRRATRPVPGALLALALLLLLGAATALGAPGTLRLVNTTPSLGRSVTVAAPGGGSFTTEPGAALVRVTDAAGAVTETTAWCVDAQREIAGGIDYPVDLQSGPAAPGFGGPAGQEAAWLISRAAGLIAAAPAPGLEAAAIQTAVWQLTGQAADIAAVTSDAALNARVAELRALAAGRAPATALALSAPATVAPGAAAVVSVTGTPGTDVTFEVAGAATLSASAVTLDAAGSAQVTVTPSTAGQITVTARADGGIVVRASHLAGTEEPQDVAYVAPVPLVATAPLSAVSPAAVTVVGVAGAPAPAPVGTTAIPAALRLTKTAPASVLRGSVIRYTLTVTNTSSRTARGVVIRDPLPAGTFLPRLPDRARLSAGAVVWRLGDLAPRASVTVRLRLRTLPAAAGVVDNAARASASNAATVRARAETRLRERPKVAPRVAPAVTG